MEAVPTPNPEMDELAKKYSMECAQLGEWGYKAHLLQVDIDAAIERIKGINKQAGELKKVQPTEPPKETA